MPAEFNSHAVVFCKCGHLMHEVFKNTVTCLTPECPEYGKDYRITITMLEEKPVARV